MNSTKHTRRQNRHDPPHLNEKRALVGYRSKRAEFKKPYFAVPSEGGVSFWAVPIVLLESAVWSGLGIYERRFIEVCVITNARTGGRENGRLVVTHDTLKAAGIKGDKIKQTIINLVKLGLVEVTHRGGPGNPARYRLTFLGHIEEANGTISYFPPTNDWIEVEREIIEGRRPARTKRHQAPGQKINSARSKCAPVSGAK
jgi:hypothetical protein